MVTASPTTSWLSSPMSALNSGALADAPLSSALSLRGQSDKSFDQMLSQKEGAPIVGVGAVDQQAESVEEKRRMRQSSIKELSEQLIGIGFILPMFKQMRQDPLKGDLFHGGQGEQAFGAQLDQLVSDRIAQRLKMSVGQAIERRYRQSDEVITGGAL